MSSNPVIAFDEAGNTGQDLLSHDQPVFVLASVHLTEEEAKELLAIIKPHQAQEAHFKKLKRRVSGQRRVIEMLAHELICTEKVKLTITLKQFMVTTKIIDLLVETLAHDDGLDLYERGANIAMSNMHHYVLPAFCGRAAVDGMHRRFVRMIRDRTEESVSDFYRLLWEMHDTTEHDSGKSEVALLIGTERIVRRVLQAVDVTTLDPAIPDFVQHCAAWGESLAMDFDVIHDESKPIAHEKEILACLMAKDEEPVVVGYDRRKYRLPLRATGITFCNSLDVPQLQVADVIAGACAYWGAGFARANEERTFWDRLNDGKLRSLVINAIWPSPEVTPQGLGTDEVGGINAADYSAEIIARQLAKRSKTQRANANE